MACAIGVNMARAINKTSNLEK